MAAVTKIYGFTERISLIILMICGVTQEIYSRDNLKAAFDSLNTLLDHKEDFVKQKEEKIANIKAVLAYENLSDINKYSVYDQLYNEYWKFDLDSAISYAKKSIDIAREMDDEYRRIKSEFQLAITYSMHGMPIQTEEILKRYNINNIPKDLRTNYYSAHIQRLTYYMYISTSDEDTRLLRSYRDSLYDTQDKSTIEYRMDLIPRMKEEYRLEAYKKLLKDVEFNSPNFARITNSIAELEEKAGNREECKIYYIRSAMADLRNATRENNSMYELSRICYQEGEYSKAFRYTQSSFNDAITAGIQFRVTQVSGFFLIVTNVYQQHESNSKGWLILMLILTCLLSLGLIISGSYILYQLRKILKIRKDLSESNDKLQSLNKRLNDMNSKLHSNNSQLEENNTIKEQYIGQFFNICSGYIDKINEYQKELYKLAANKHYEELVKKLRSTKLIDDEINTLYNHFDTIFLNLYPTFVNDINAILKEEERMTLKHGSLLNKELRILALLRLGITDSEKIANFLHCSISTVYNYRTKMRNKATDSNTGFEERVMGIGNCAVSE